MQTILVATSNPHKLREIADILGPLGIHVLDLHEAGLDQLREPIEDGATFEANATIKAKYYAQHADRICLADDSGLEVDALAGAPGVHSARYAGIGATRSQRDQANNRKLLAALRSVPPEKRQARFVCSMVIADPQGSILATSRGTFEGVIIDEPRGCNGFGYDPLLLLPDVGKTSAELAPAEKNARSHRGRAAKAIAGLIQGLVE